MKHLLLSLAVVLAAAGLSCGCHTPGPATPAETHLPTPLSEAERNYLGLPAAAADFQLEDIRCEILVVDCFDMYCHICQSGAKHVNELYRLTQERDLGSRVKVVGLGVGDTPLEVATYKEKLKVPFPLFPDRRALVAKRFGEVKLPSLLVLRNAGGRLQLLHRSTGALLDPAKLVSQLQADLASTPPHARNDGIQAPQPTCPVGSTACRSSARTGDSLTDSSPKLQ